MKELNADFHIHGRYSGGTSKNMTVPLIAEQAQLKGLDVVATADALHPRWLKHLKENLVEEDGLYICQGSKTRFIVQTEVEDVRRVHHVILFPSLSSAQNLQDLLKKHSHNMAADGRPNVKLDGAQIVDYVRAVGALVGPAHAFTPWTALYKEYDSLRDCYQDNLKHVDFLELGLSADTESADRIGELKDLTYMSNSDCHSPWPHRLGREFNRLKIKDASFEEVAKAIRREDGRGFTLNVGLNPLEGKYHVSACSRCYLKYRWEDAVKLRKRCPECRGLIKKGVQDRIGELADTNKAVHPSHRPPYIKILPLAEVIGLAYKTKTLTSKTVKRRWDALVQKFGSEISVLVDADVKDVLAADPEVGKIVNLFREGKMKYVAGGGGMYGRPTLEGEKDKYYSGDQKSITDY